MTINFSNIDAAAQQIWQALDAKDGTDKKITKNIWDQFRAQTGVKAKTIKWMIEERNAVRSIKYYLSVANDEVKQKICSHLGLTSTDAVDTTQEVETSETVETGTEVKSNEEKLRDILNKAGIEVTEEDFLKILAKYENKLSMQATMNYTDAQIAQDVIDMANGLKFEKAEDGFRTASQNAHTEKINPEAYGITQKELDGIYKIIRKEHPDYNEEQVEDAVYGVLGEIGKTTYEEKVAAYAKWYGDKDATPYTIQGVQEALDYAAEHKEDPETAYKMQSEAFQRFGNAQVQLYDRNGDNKIDKNEYIAYEQQKSDEKFNQSIAEKLFDYLNGDDDYIDAQEMTLHGYAMAKLKDGKDDKTGEVTSTGYDITYDEWNSTNNTLFFKMQGDKNENVERTFKKYEEYKKTGYEVIYNYKAHLPKTK